MFDGFLFLQNHHAAIGQFGVKGSLFYSKDQEVNYRDHFQEKVKIESDSGDFNSVIVSKSHVGEQKTIFSYRSAHRYSQNLNITTLSSLSSIKENNIGASQSVDLDEKITQNYQRLYVYLNAYRKNNDITDKKAIEDVLGQLNRILKECLDIAIVDLGDIMDGKGTLYFKKPDQSTPFDYNLLSSGEKEVVDILLDTFLKKNTYTDSIYCIDEPELHLNTSIQRKLLLEIEKLIPDNCQVWVATHSIGFLRALQEDLRDKSQVLDFSEKDYFNSTCEIKPIATTRKNWQRIFQTALEDLTGLLAPKKIIYCEGRADSSIANEEQGLDADIYNEIFSEQHHDTLFISSGGGGETIKNAALALKVLNKAFVDTELYLLKDRDTLSDAERQSFLQDNAIHKMLVRREIENYIFDKEIIKKFCAASTTTFDEAKYDNMVTEIHTQDLMPVQQAIQASCGVSGSVPDFKRKLAKVILNDTQIYKELSEVIFLEPHSTSV